MKEEKHQPKVFFQDLGQMDYQEAWDYQTVIHKELVERKKSFGWEMAPTPPQHRLLFVEHNPVYTLGKSGSIDHLLLNEDELRAQGVAFYKINRGGDITFHGPGQIVGYPIFDLDWFFHDVKRYVSLLEGSIIDLLGQYGLEATRYAGYTGVWLPPKQSLPWRKICAIGVHLSRWVTLHGFAFNVNTDLSYFRGIVPCGIASGAHEVTSLARELGEVQNVDKVKTDLIAALAKNFDFELSRLD